MPDAVATKKQDPDVTAPTAPTTAATPGLEEQLVDPLVAMAQPQTDQGGGDGGGAGPKLTWRQALGEFLGDALYDGLAPVLGEASLKKVANEAWNDAVGKVADWIKSQADTPDESKIADKFTEELKKGLKDKAGGLVNFNLEGVAEGVADFARKQPELIILAALAGAAAFVATNQSIPELKQKLGLGKAGKIAVGAKFTGGFLDLFKSIEQTVQSLKLDYSVGGFQAGGDYERKDDGSKEIKGQAGYTVKDKYADAKGKDVEFERFKLQGNAGVKLNPAGGVQGTQFGGNMNLNLGDKGQHKFAASGGAQNGISDKGTEFSKTQGKLGYNTGGFGLGLGFDRSTVPAGTTSNYNLQGGYKSPNFSLNGNANMMTSPKGNLGTLGVESSFKSGGLGVTGSGMVGTDGRYKVGGSANYDAGNGWKVNGGANVQNMPAANGALQQGWDVQGGASYEKNNKYLKFQGNYGQQGGQNTGGFTIGAGIRF